MLLLFFTVVFGVLINTWYYEKDEKSTLLFDTKAKEFLLKFQHGIDSTKLLLLENSGMLAI